MQSKNLFKNYIHQLRPYHQLNKLKKIKKEFAKETLEKNIKNFVIYITSFNSKQITIYLAWEAQIDLLLTKKFVILAKYLDFVDIFLKTLAAKLFKRSNINKHLIDLKPSKQPSYKPIYNARLVKLEIFKTYIRTNFANSFICLFKFSAKVFIFFILKFNSNFYLCVIY